jgi:hypothetical protein
MAINEEGGFLARAGAPAESPVDQQPMQQPSEAASSGFQQEEVSGEEQDAYDRVVMAGMKVMFENDDTREKIEKRLEADKQHPAKTLADTASMIMVQLDKQSGEGIPETVILPAAIEILEQLMEFADSIGVFPIDDAVMNHAGQLMVNSLGEQYGVEPEDLQAMMEGVDPAQLKQIEEEQGNFARKQPPMEAGGV